VRHARALGRFSAFLVVSLAFAGLYLLTLPLPRRIQQRVQRLWCAGVNRCAGLDVKVEGTPVERDGPILFLVNHVSYFDIPAFGSLVDATFVAKSEVASWPLFGQFSRLTGTVFIPRRARQTGEQVALLRRRFLKDHRLILFPEGTNGDGRDVLPFKSSLLQSVTSEATGLPVTVQAVSLAFTRLRSGEPLVGERQDLFAWIGADDMFPHLWRALGSSGAEVRVVFHPPLEGDVVRDRKVLARAAEAQVRAGVARLWSDVLDVPRSTAV
jgi:1-acyl-sn-glycerol-3-phosphate acyltransferase